MAGTEEVTIYMKKNLRFLTYTKISLFILNLKVFTKMPKYGLMTSMPAVTLMDILVF